MHEPNAPSLSRSTMTLPEHSGQFFGILSTTVIFTVSSSGCFGRVGRDGREFRCLGLLRRVFLTQYTSAYLGQDVDIQPAPAFCVAFQDFRHEDNVLLVGVDQLHFGKESMHFCVGLFSKIAKTHQLLFGLAKKDFRSWNTIPLQGVVDAFGETQLTDGSFPFQLD